MNFNFIKSQSVQKIIFVSTENIENNKRNENFLEKEISSNAFNFFHLEDTQQSFDALKVIINKHNQKFPNNIPVIFICGEQTKKIFKKYINQTNTVSVHHCFTQKTTHYTDIETKIEFIVIFGYHISCHSSSKGCQTIINNLKRSIRLGNILRTIERTNFPSNIFELFNEDDKIFILNQKLAKKILLQEEECFWPDDLQHLNKFEFDEASISNIENIQSIFGQKFALKLMKIKSFAKRIFYTFFVQFVENLVTEHGKDFAKKMLQTSSFCANIENNNFQNVFKQTIDLYGVEKTSNLFCTGSFCANINNDHFLRCFENLVEEVGLKSTVSLVGNSTFSKHISSSTSSEFILEFKNAIEKYTASTAVHLFSSSFFCKHILKTEFQKNINQLFIILNSNSLHFVEILKSPMANLLFENSKFAFDALRFAIDVFGKTHFSLPFRSSNFLKRLLDDTEKFKIVCSTLVDYVGREPASMLFSSQSFSKHVGTRELTKIVFDLSFKLGFRMSIRLIAENCFLLRIMKDDKIFKNYFFNFFEEHGAHLTTKLFSNGSFCARFSIESFRNAFTRISETLNDVETTINLFEHGSVACGFVYQKNGLESSREAENSSNDQFEQRIIQLIKSGADTDSFISKIFCKYVKNDEDIFLFFMECLNEAGHNLANKCFKNDIFLNSCVSIALRNEIQMDFAKMNTYSNEVDSQPLFEQIKNSMLSSCPDEIRNGFTFSNKRKCSAEDAEEQKHFKK